ncbi:MAG: GH32 C-terminal domain-containing protein [Bradymonadia bacterium]
MSLTTQSEHMPYIPLRPIIHFTPEVGWMNDPNGMVYVDGVYHLFYQANPNGLSWGDIHWGHATSTDLVRWQYHPPALKPHPELGMVFSGCAVFDAHDTLGVGAPSIVALFTHSTAEGHQVQSLAYSTDKGQTWCEWPDNPIIPNPGLKDFRDPKVRWHRPTGRWVMVLAAGDRVQIWVSRDLRRWHHSSDFGEGLGAHGGVWECPDVFPLEYEGRTRWIMLVSLDDGGPNSGSGTQYFVGDFDGERFVAEPIEQPLWLDYGPDHYAAVTWSGAPTPSTSVLMLGWMNNWKYARTVPATTWRGAMATPRTLSLKETPEGLRLSALPAEQLEAFRGAHQELPWKPLNESTLKMSLPEVADVSVDWLPERDDLTVVVTLSGVAGERVVIRVGFEGMSLDRSTVFAQREGPTLCEAPGQASHGIRLIIDHGSVEVFSLCGRRGLSALVMPSAPFDTLTVQSEGGVGRVRGEVYALSG